VRELELKQKVSLRALQSKKPLITVTVSREEEFGPLPIPAYGDAARRKNDPFTVTSLETEDDPPSRNPDPIAQPRDPLALIFPPEIVNSKTVELPYPDPCPSPYPEPIPAPPDPLALRCPPEIVNANTVELPYPGTYPYPYPDPAPDPDPIPAPYDPLALMFPPEIDNLKTVE
jgi:hypothetical protein